jgi:hypothetical protein
MGAIMARNNLRFNVEVAGPDKDEEEKYGQTYTEVLGLLNEMEEGDALVINATAGPKPGEAWL